MSFLEDQPLHVAAYNADLEAVQALLAGGAAVDALDEGGCAPLYWACFRGAVGDQAPVVAALIAGGADPDLADAQDMSTPLILAVQAGVPAVVEVLLAAGAAVDKGADGGVTGLMIAARDGNARMTDLLLDAGADPSIRCGSFDAAAYAHHGGHEALAQKLETLCAAR